MCLICIELAKGSLKKQDFVNNYLELVLTDPEHADEVFNKWEEKESDEEFFELE
jgi:hypothetical protein